MGQRITKKAAVHCVIIGFANFSLPQKRIFTDKSVIIAENINPHLLDAPNIFLHKRNKPLFDSEIMIYGSEPREGGNLILSPDERDEFLKESPAMSAYVKRFMSSEDFINGKLRYCLWLKDADLTVLRKSRIVMQRLKACVEFRENSKQKQAHSAKDSPTLFASERQPTTEYLLIPVVSSENLVTFQSDTCRLMSSSVTLALQFPTHHFTFRNFNKFNSYGLDKNFLRKIEIRLQIFQYVGLQ